MPSTPRTVIREINPRLWVATLPIQETSFAIAMILAIAPDTSDDEHLEGMWEFRGLHIGDEGATEFSLAPLANVIDVRKELSRYSRQVRREYRRFGVWRKAYSLIHSAKYSRIQIPRQNVDELYEEYVEAVSNPPRRSDQHSHDIRQFHTNYWRGAANSTDPTNPSPFR